MKIINRKIGYGQQLIIAILWQIKCQFQQQYQNFLYFLFSSVYFTNYQSYKLIKIQVLSSNQYLNLIKMHAKQKSFIKMLTKTDLIKWINDVLNLNISKIQSLGNGYVYSLLINHYHPNLIPQSNLIKNPKSEYQCLNNLKLLQTAFIKLNIKKNIQIDKLCKQKYQDNWEFVSWLHKQLNSQRENTFPQKNLANPLDNNQKKKNHLEFVFNQSKDQIFFKRCPGQITPANGKSSVSSELFQNNYIAVIDKVKQILVKQEQDEQKVRQLKMLLNIRDTKTEQRQRLIETQIKQLITDEKNNIGSQSDVKQTKMQLKF